MAELSPASHRLPTDETENCCLREVGIDCAVTGPDGGVTQDSRETTSEWAGNVLESEFSNQ